MRFLFSILLPGWEGFDETFSYVEKGGVEWTWRHRDGCGLVATTEAGARSAGG